MWPVAAHFFVKARCHSRISDRLKRALRSCSIWTSLNGWDDCMVVVSVPPFFFRQRSVDHREHPIRSESMRERAKARDKILSVSRKMLALWPGESFNERAIDNHRRKREKDIDGERERCSREEPRSSSNTIFWAKWNAARTIASRIVQENSVSDLNFKDESFASFADHYWDYAITVTESRQPGN